MKKYLPLFFVLQSCIGLGDMFAKREKVIGNYYLVETENRDYSIGYKVDGLYEARSPEGVVAYAVKDTVLVLKVKPYQKATFYYVINTNAGEMARKNDYHLGSIAASDFQSSWLGTMKLQFIAVK